MTNLYDLRKLEPLCTEVFMHGFSKTNLLDTEAGQMKQAGRRAGGQLGRWAGGQVGRRLNW
jgi:hypothetical protein